MRRSREEQLQNLRQYLSGQAECFSVRSVSSLVLIHCSVYQTHLQRRLPSHTPTWQQTQSKRDVRTCPPPPSLTDQHIVSDSVEPPVKMSSLARVTPTIRGSR